MLLLVSYWSHNTVKIGYVYNLKYFLLICKFKLENPFLTVRHWWNCTNEVGPLTNILLFFACKSYDDWPFEIDQTGYNYFNFVSLKILNTIMQTLFFF